MRLPHVGMASVGLLAAALAGCGGSDGPTGTQNGAIQGSVTAGGSGVAGVSVALSGGGTQTTNGSGSFQFGNVSPGSHSLTLTLPTGYELESGQQLTRSVTVSSGQTATVSWSLRQGSPPEQVEVAMQAASFSPADVEVALGGTVTWVNSAGNAHTITPDNPSQTGVWQSQNVPADASYSFSHTFDTAGTYPYDCQLHAGMTGTVEVR